MDWHGCGAEHHGDVDGNLVERGHVCSLLRSAATVSRYVYGHHGMVNEWLMREIHW